MNRFVIILLISFCIPSIGFSEQPMFYKAKHLKRFKPLKPGIQKELYKDINKSLSTCEYTMFFTKRGTVPMMTLRKANKQETKVGICQSDITCRINLGENSIDVTFKGVQCKALGKKCPRPKACLKDVDYANLEPTKIDFKSNTGPNFQKTEIPASVLSHSND